MPTMDETKLAPSATAVQEASNNTASFNTTLTSSRARSSSSRLPAIDTSTASYHNQSQSSQAQHQPKHNSSTTPNSAVRRKPVASLPSTTYQPQPHPLPPQAFPSGGKVVAIGRQSIDSNTSRPARVPWSQHNSRTSSPRRPSNFNGPPPPPVLSPDIPQSPGLIPFHELPPEQARNILLGLDTNSYSPSTLTHVRNSDPPRSPVVAQRAPLPKKTHRSETMPGRAEAPGPIQIQVNHPYGVNGEPPTPSKQGMSKFWFSGWKGNSGSSPINESSPITTISDRSTPAQSPNGTSITSFPITGKSLPHSIDTNKANAPVQALLASGSFSRAPPTPNMSQVEELEEELRDISAELAGSIRREMDLEDQVERLQNGGPNSLEKDKRTSDYYSDSGTSSVRDPEVNGTRDEDLSKLRRRSEFEKAQMKLDIAQKLNEERNKRRELEEHIRTLEDHIQTLEQGGSKTGGTGRVTELETALEDNRRRLSEEKKHKENFEHLISALQNDLIQHRNERDNLRDEVVPALRARVEGLESESSENQKLVYENTRMQQELNQLKAGRFDSIAEDGRRPPSRVGGVKRSSSTLVRGNTSLSRSNSVSNKGQETREVLVDRVKDIEAQRDALHRALQSLLQRQKYQSHEHEKRIKLLELERDAFQDSASPRRKGFDTEVKDLRYEMNELRKRADEALEQKWQCEKGLGSLKKDLDRAEHETATLRNLLVENEIAVPDLSSIDAVEAQNSTIATSATLQKAYRELREAQNKSITRLKELNGIAPSGVEDAKTMETLDVLLKSMSNAEAERDYAQKQAEAFKAQAESLRDIASHAEGDSKDLATQLQASASRIENLSSSVRKQLSQNSELRERLGLAIGTGEREQKVSTTRINQLQERLRELEDKLATAQQQSEDKLQSSEDDILAMRSTSRPSLHRLKAPSPSGRLPNSPISPNMRSPRISRTSSGPGMSMSEALRSEALEKKVRELEAALKEADLEMGEVVQRMNQAQIDVMELQNARDDAIRQTRALQTQIQKENEKVGTLTQSMA